MTADLPNWVLNMFAEQDAAEVQLKPEEKEALAKFHQAFELELVERGGKFDSPQEESDMVEKLLGEIPGARAAFDRRSHLEDEFSQKRRTSSRRIN